MDPVKKSFYEFHASMMEPWDGPASISFTDGKIIGATLDRNGLRPSRYCVTTDDRVIMASESGVLPIDPWMIKEKGRLQSGKMFVVDLEQGRIISDDELKQKICSQKPYAEWLNKYKTIGVIKKQSVQSKNGKKKIHKTSSRFGGSYHYKRYVRKSRMRSGLINIRYVLTNCPNRE